MSMWVAARAVGFPGSTVMRRLRFSGGPMRGYGVSPFTSKIRESPARHNHMTMLWDFKAAFDKL